MKSEKKHLFIFLSKLAELLCMCFNCFLLCKGGLAKGNACRRLGRLEEGLRGPSTLPESFIEFGYQETSFVSFYRKFAGVLQDVLEFLQDVL